MWVYLTESRCSKNRATSRRGYSHRCRLQGSLSNQTQSLGMVEITKNIYFRIALDIHAMPYTPKKFHGQHIYLLLVVGLWSSASKRFSQGSLSCRSHNTPQIHSWTCRDATSHILASTILGSAIHYCITGCVTSSFFLGVRAPLPLPPISLASADYSQQR